LDCVDEAEWQVAQVNCAKSFGSVWQSEHARAPP
jgi:hypothetical protein